MFSASGSKFIFITFLIIAVLLLGIGSLVYFVGSLADTQQDYNHAQHIADALLAGAALCGLAARLFYSKSKKLAPPPIK